MRKIICLILTFVICLGMVSCSKTKIEHPSDEGGTVEDVVKRTTNETEFGMIELSLQQDPRFTEDIYTFDFTDMGTKEVVDRVEVKKADGYKTMQQVHAGQHFVKLTELSEAIDGQTEYWYGDDYK